MGAENQNNKPVDAENKDGKQPANDSAEKNIDQHSETDTQEDVVITENENAYESALRRIFGIKDGEKLGNVEERMLDIAIETIYEIERECDYTDLDDSVEHIHLTEIIKILVNNGASWDNEVQCMLYGKTKKAVLRKVKFDKFYILLSNRTNALLKSLGWKPSLFG